MFNKDHLYDELRRIEQDVVRGEQQLAEQEDLLVSLKTQNKDTAQLEAFLDELRSRQRDSSRRSLSGPLYDPTMNESAHS